MDKLRVMVAHYTIVGGIMMKLSEVCIGKGAINSANEVHDQFVQHITEDVERLNKDQNNVDVTKWDITDRIVQVTFSGLNGMHVLEYYITMVSD